MWTLTGLAGLFALVSEFGWVFVVGAGAFTAWYLKVRAISWPPDVEEILVQAKLAQPDPHHRANAPGTPPFAPRQPYIPFRALTVSEMFGGAFKIMTRNWPTLVGVPVAILSAWAALVAAIFGVMSGLVQQAVESSFASDDFTSASFTSLSNALMVIMAVTFLLSYVLALPADALLIALTVITTHKAVSGQPIRLAEIVAIARRRIFAVVRLTLAYYTILIVIDIICYMIIFAVMLAAPALGYFLLAVLFIASFGAGIMLSMAPMALVVEGIGLGAAFRRSLKLAKAGWCRIAAIHLMWAVCVAPLLFVPSLVVPLAGGMIGMAVFYLLAFGVLIACTRTLQMLVYTDLRMRQEGYGRELQAEWTRNTAHAG